MAAHLASVRRALAQQDAAVDRFKAIVQENSALNERILEHEDTIARQAAALSTLRSEADDTMTARAAQTAARRLEQQNASLQRDLSAAHEAARALDKERVALADALHERDRRLETLRRDSDRLRKERDEAVSKLSAERSKARRHAEEALLRKREHDSLIQRVISDKDKKNGELNAMTEVVERLRSDLDLKNEREWSVVEAVPSKARCVVRRAHAVSAVDVCLSNGQAVSGGDDGSLVVWHVSATPSPSIKLATDRREACASVDLKHDLILCASKSTSIQLWDINGRRRLSLQHSHQKKARMGGAVLLSSSTYATCASDGIIKFWDHDQVREERLCPSGCSALDRVGSSVVIAGHADGACRLWDARSDVCALDMGPRDSTAAVRAVAAEDHFVASLNADHALYIYDRRKGVAVHSLRHDALKAPERCRVAVAPGALHVAAPSTNGAVVVFDARTGACATTLQPSSLEAPPVNAVAWAGGILATVDADGGLALWD